MDEQRDIQIEMKCSQRFRQRHTNTNKNIKVDTKRRQVEGLEG